MSPRLRHKAAFSGSFSKALPEVLLGFRPASLPLGRYPEVGRIGGCLSVQTGKPLLGLVGFVQVQVEGTQNLDKVGIARLDSLSEQEVFEGLRVISELAISSPRTKCPWKSFGFWLTKLVSASTASCLRPAD